MMKRNRILLILGKKGSGKTELSKLEAKKLDRVVFLDPMNQYVGGYTFKTFYEFQNEFYEIYVKKSKFKVVCKFTQDEDYEEFFIYIYNFPRIALVVDEADQFAPSRYIMPGFKRLVSYGRHQEIDLILVSRRPYEINALVRSQADEIVTFKQTEPRDLQYIAMMGFDPDEVSSLDFDKFEHIRRMNE